MSLYIGANYHPHDWPESHWGTDVELMKQAGFTTVRLGHLCWDSYEPEEGVYTFEWFDQVMELFAAAHIGVFLDISVRPAPVWVHKLCPGCNIWGKGKTEADSLRRYMEDVADPAYQFYALRFARVLVTRYKNHPALMAFGLCNELGDGYLSHSEYARKRFVEWLKKKYETVKCLNEAWSAQRWSRRLTSFEDAVIPVNEVAVGAPEPWLDMRRFISDGIADFAIQLKGIVDECAPGIPHSSNHYAEKEGFGFDYLKFSDQFVDYPGIGFYPGYDVEEKYQFISSIYQQRLAETDKPMWCLEFQTGSKGVPWGPAGALRMLGLLCLLNRTEMILGWTFRSMLGGEEQYLYGLLGHDGIPTPNYYEFQQLAADMKKLEAYAFPYLPKPDIAVAYSYESAWVSQYSSEQYRQTYSDNMTLIQQVFFEQNRDYNVVDLHSLKQNYKLLIIPGHILMDDEAADTVRTYVSQGGTVIITGNSAVVDVNGRVYGTSRPGDLTDVFGVRVNGFYRTDMAWMPDVFFLKTEAEVENLPLKAAYVEQLELETAKVYAEFQEMDLCAISVNQYGKGKAYYVAAETDSALLDWLLKRLSEEQKLCSGVSVPDGIQARQIADNQYFYVNTTNQAIVVPIPTCGRGVLTDIRYEKEMILKAYDGELLITG